MSDTNSLTDYIPHRALDALTKGEESVFNASGLLAAEASVAFGAYKAAEMAKIAKPYGVLAAVAGYAVTDLVIGHFMDKHKVENKAEKKI